MVVVVAVPPPTCTLILGLGTRLNLLFLSRVEPSWIGKALAVKKQKKMNHALVVFSSALFIVYFSKFTFLYGPSMFFLFILINCFNAGVMTFWIFFLKKKMNKQFWQILEGWTYYIFSEAPLATMFGILTKIINQLPIIPNIPLVFIFYRNIFIITITLYNFLKTGRRYLLSPWQTGHIFSAFRLFRSVEFVSKICDICVHSSEWCLKHVYKISDRT